MRKLGRDDLQYIQRQGRGIDDRRIAEQLGLTVKEVRRARRRIVATESQAPSNAAAQAVDREEPTSFSARVTRWMAGRPFVYFCIVLVGACIAFANMIPIINPDFGWHVALGRYIWENKTVPTTETFSHTARGAHMVAHEWLSELCYYGVIRATGILGLRWVHTGLALVILLIVYGWQQRLLVAPGPALFGAFLYFIIANGRFHVRPHVFDMAFLAVMYGFLFVVKPALTGRQLIGIFAIIVVWANFHSGVTLLATIVLLYVAMEAFQQITRWRLPLTEDLGGGNLRRLGILAVLVVVGVMATPNHVHLFPYIIESKRINSQWSAEWQSIAGYWGSPIMKPLAVEAYWLVAIATVIAAALSVRRGSLSSLAVVVLLAVLPLTGQRFVASMFVPVIFLMHRLHCWMMPAGVEKTGPRRQTAYRLACAVAPLAVLAGVYPVLGTDMAVPGVRFRSAEGRFFDRDHLGSTLRQITSRLRAENDLQRNYFPVGAVTFLDEVNLSGRLFNSSDWGGYILFRMYTKYPVFMDGRWVDYGEWVFKDSLAVERHWKAAFAKLDEYGIDILLVHRDWMSKDKQTNGEWIPIFENYNASLFLRNTPGSAANLERCAAYYGERHIPFDRIKGFGEQQAIQTNRDWAKQMRVQRQHLAMGKYPPVNGW